MVWLIVGFAMISEKYARAGINLTTCKYYTEMRAISGKYAMGIQGQE